MPIMVSIDEAAARVIARFPVSSGIRKLKVSHCSEITCAWLEKPTISSKTR